MQLRPYQSEALDAIDDALGKGVRRPLVVLPTGGGKTIVFAQLPKRHNGKMLVLAHRQELLTQAQEKILWANPELTVEIEQGQNIADMKSDVIVASTATLGRANSKRLEKFHPHQFATIVIDEAHHAAAPSYKRILEYFKPNLQLGVTATPQRGDKTRLTDVFDEIVYFKTIQELIEDGYLSNLAGYRISTATDISGVTTRSGDWAEGELSEAVNNEERNKLAVEAYKDKAPGKKAIVFCVDVQHAEDMASTFNEAGISCGVITGAMKTEEREEVLQKFRSGETPVISNCQVLTEGFDEPSVEAIIFARPTKSQLLYTQCLDEHTEVLTPKGWRGPDDIQDNDGLVAVDPATMQTQIVPILSRVNRTLNADEKMYGIQSPTMDVRVTGGHRMLVSFRSGRAKTFGDFEFLTAEELATSKAAFRLPISAIGRTREAHIRDVDIQFLGWFLSDGCLSKNGQISISQAEHQPQRQQLEACLNEGGFSYSVTQYAGGSQWVRTSPLYRYNIHKDSWQHLVRFVDKNMESFAYGGLSARQVGILLEAIHLGDGAKQLDQTWTRRSYHISTGNKIYAENLQKLCVQNGFKCNLSVHTAGRENPCYILHIKNTTTRHLDNSATDRPNFSEISSATGERVWCVENEYQTLVTRRNGKVAIMGNCVGRGTRLHPGKSRCIIIDLADATAGKKPMGLPTLMGLPPEFDSEGEDLTEVQKKYKELEDKAPAEAARAKSVQDIAQAWERIDLFMPPPPNEALLEYTAFIWMETGQDRYILNLPTTRERLMMDGDALGRYTVKLKGDEGEKVLGVCETMEEAFKRSDKWIQRHRDDQVQLLDNNAQWRVDSPSDKQIKWLKKFGVPITADLTKGQASIMLDKLFAENPRPKRSPQQEWAIRKAQQRKW